MLKLKLFDQPPAIAPGSGPSGTAPRECPTSWVFALPVGEPLLFWDEEAQDYSWTTVDRAHAEALVANTNRAIQDWAAETPAGRTPYRPPILREHQFEGWRGGDLTEARLAGSQAEGTFGIYLRTSWLPSLWDQIQEGSTAHVSIGTLNKYVDSKGRDYSPCIQELSITETPRLKNLGTIQDTVSLQLSDAIARGSKTMGYEEIMAMLQTVVDRLAALEEGLPALRQEVADVHAVCKETLSAIADEAIAEEEAVEGEMDLMDPKEEEPKVEMSEEEVLAEILGLELAEKVQRLRKIKGNGKGQGLRLNDAPSPSVKPAPRREQDRLAQARSRGLSGLAAIEAAFGK